MNINNIDRYSLSKIEDKLRKNELPFSGVTRLGSAAFHFLKPSFYAGIAMHAGNRVRPEVQRYLMANGKDRFREEDPYTDYLIRELPIQIIGCDSRFEYDLNRSPERAIYATKIRSWGLEIWKDDLPQKERNISISKHREFHGLMDIVTGYLLNQNRYALLFDMHSFCYQRDSAVPWYEDPKPEINLGTEAVNREVFGPAINRFIQEISTTKIDGHQIRVAENEIFRGGYLARRLCRNHYRDLLFLAIEYKKLFMNELTGELHEEKLERLISGFSHAAEELISSGFFAKQDSV